MELFEGINSSKIYKAIDQMLVFGLFFFAPTQLARHFWPEWTYIFGIRVDFLALTVSTVDILVLLFLFIHLGRVMGLIAKIPPFILVTIVLGVIVHLLWSVEPVHSVYILAHTGGYLLVMSFIASRLDTYRHIVLWAIALGALVQTALVAGQIISQSSVQGVWYWAGERAFTLSMPVVAKVYAGGREWLRPYGTFSHPNSLAGFYLFVFFLTFALSKERGEWADVVRDTLLLLLAPILIVASFSKTAIIVFAIVYVWRMMKRAGIVQSNRLQIVQIVGLMTMVFSVFNFSGDPGSLAKRVDMVAHAVALFVQNPLLGVGVGNYLIAQSSSLRLDSVASYYQPVHNMFLLFLVEFGMVGVVVGYVAIRTRMTDIIEGVMRYRYVGIVVVLTGMMDHYWLTLPQNQFLLLFLVALILRSALPKKA